MARIHLPEWLLRMLRGEHNSVRYRFVRVDLVAILLRDGKYWRENFHLFANNRFISINIKQSMEEPLVVSDHERLNPYRSGSAHMAANRLFRKAVGRAPWPIMHRGPVGQLGLARHTIEAAFSRCLP